MLRALDELEIEGIPTTRDFAAEILRTQEFTSGDYSTSLLEERAAAEVAA
jgi:biotin carboxylase